MFSFSLSFIGLINKAKICKMILNSFVPMNSLVVAFTGLPACGKTKAMTKMLRKFMSPAILDKTTSMESKDRCLSIYNLCVLGGYPFKKFLWTPTSKRYSITYFTLSDLIRSAILRNVNPLEFNFDLETPLSPDCCFESVLHNEHINWLLKQLGDLYGLIKKGHLNIGLFQTGVTLVNGLDVGVNKGLYDFLPVIAAFCRKLVRIVFFSLDRDVKNLSEHPDLSDDKYKERHDQYVMRWRPRLSYLLHHAAAGYVPNSGKDHRTIMVGVTESLDDKTASQLLQEARQVIENEAKSLKIEQTFHNEWLHINLSNDKSISRTRDALEQMIVHNPKFRCVVQLRWIFLRSLIASVDQENPPVIMAKKVIVELAGTLGMENQEVDSFLETFTDFASLLYAPIFESLREYVIVDLKRFTDLLDKIYYPSDPNSLIARYGIITETVINELMAPDLAKQVLTIMTSIGMVARVPPKQLLLNDQLQNDEFYFLPTARTSDISNGAQQGSAYIVIKSDHVPVSSQAIIADSILKEMPELILVAHTPNNITKVRIEHDRSQPAIEIDIIYQGRMTELRICNTDDTVLSLLTHQTAIDKCSKLLTICCERFTSQYFRGLRFNFGLKCCRGEKRYHYLYPDKEPESCDDCKALTNSKQDFWIKAAHEVNF